LIFSLIITIGFIYEIGRGALKIESKQNNSQKKQNTEYLQLLGNLSNKSLNGNQINQVSVNNKSYYSTKQPVSPAQARGYPLRKRGDQGGKTFEKKLILPTSLIRITLFC
jgi:hypothetical protein